MWWIFAIIVIVIILFIVGYINRKKVSEDLAALEIPGELINISNGSTVHAVLLGRGKYTMVMLSGMGTSSPYADFHALAEKISQHCRVIILEVPGYGFAPVTDAPRTLENYEKEISETFQHFGINDNVILMPHSYSGIFTYDYAKKHPETVCALFNDDASVWHQYYLTEGSGIMGFIISVEKFLIINYGKIPFDKTIRKMVVKENNISEEYLDTYVTIMQSNVLNRNVMEEEKNFKNWMKPYLNTKYDENLYVVNMVVHYENDKTDNLMKKQCGFNWKEAHEDLISNPAIQKTVEMYGAQHYIHHTHVNEMEELAVELIDSLEQR